METNCNAFEVLKFSFPPPCLPQPDLEHIRIPQKTCLKYGTVSLPMQRSWNYSWLQAEVLHAFHISESRPLSVCHTTDSIYKKCKNEGFQAGSRIGGNYTRFLPGQNQNYN